MTQSAQLILPSLAAAYRVSDILDVGVRVSWGLARLEASTYVWGVRNYEEWVGQDGVVNLDTRDNFIPAAGAGALLRPLSWLEFGVAYSSPLNVRS